MRMDWSTGTRQPGLRKSPVPRLQPSGDKIESSNIDFESTRHDSFELLAGCCHRSAKSAPSRPYRYPADPVPNSHQATKPTVIAAAKSATRLASR